MSSNISLTGTQKTFIKEYQYTPSNDNIQFTSIILLTYNQLPYTKLCIESIRKFTPKNSYELIVIDNNSTDSTVKWLKKQKDLKVIYNDTNNGFPKGCNQGIKISKGENILLLNNDTIVTPNWLNNLDKALHSSDDIGAVGAISNSCSNAQQIDVHYNDLESLFSFSKNYNISDHKLWDSRFKLIGYCYMIKKNLLNKIGFLDEIFTPGNYEDDDLSFRVLNAGYKLLLCKDTFIHHFGSVSFKNEGTKFADVFFENQNKINEKWGFDTGYCSKYRFEFLQCIDEPLDKSLNVLDIGMGCAPFLLEVKNKFKNSNIYSIECCKEMIPLSKQIKNLQFNEVNDINLNFEPNYFNYIFIDEIIEQMLDPWNFISSLKKYLKEDGYLIISSFNIMHIQSLKTILSGRFPSSNSGIFNKINIRFFTLSELDELLIQSNYKIEFISAIGSQLSQQDETLINVLNHTSSPQLKQQYNSYQYIVKCTPC